MLNFTVGPVQSHDAVKEIGSRDVPYFRTPEFSDVMLENERLMLKFAKAPADSRAVFITGSGTASMEAAIMNTLSAEDRALVVNGGTFGERFVEMLRIHEIPYDEIRLSHGQPLLPEHLLPFEGQAYTAFLINIHETSTGVHYNTRLVADFCQRNHLFLIVDAISSFLADDFDMAAMGARIMITGSQKALACPPGVSILVLDSVALDRVANHDPHMMYLDLKSALRDQERGQTPFTPAVGTLLQIHARLKEIDEHGGVEGQIAHTAELARYFRSKIKDLPFQIVSDALSNAVTPLHPTTASACDIVRILKDEYGIWICPNGGSMRDTVFRVGHIGCLHKSDFDQLIGAFEDLKKRHII